MSRLDDAIARARDLTVREDHARRYVVELARWARPVSEPRRWRAPAFAFAVVVAAAAATLLLLVRRDTAERSEAIRVGDRVAIVAEPSTRYRVVAADAEHTDVLVERGTLTARLWPGARPHRLALRGAGVEAVATGTVFALEVDDAGARVHVHEGKVAVARGNEHVDVAAGTAWPRGVTYRGRRAGEQLLALAAPPPLPAPPRHAPIDAGVAETPADARLVEAPTDATVARVPTPAAAVLTDASPPPQPPAPALNERYRRARLLRGQGNFDAAIAECIAIADANDPTWSPIALVEAVRIELGPRASPERAVTLADRFTADWAAHQLAPEVRDLRCRALRQLDRADECQGP